jgi:hypothetical protein
MKLMHFRWKIQIIKRTNIQNFEIVHEWKGVKTYYQEKEFGYPKVHHIAT